MGFTKDARCWCDYCGREIAGEPLKERRWTFHGERCKKKKFSLVFNPHQDYPRSLYAISGGASDEREEGEYKQCTDLLRK